MGGEGRQNLSQGEKNLSDVLLQESIQDRIDQLRSKINVKEQPDTGRGTTYPELETEELQEAEYENHFAGSGSNQRRSLRRMETGKKRKYAWGQAC